MDHTQTMKNVAFAVHKKYRHNHLFVAQVSTPVSATECSKSLVPAVWPAPEPQAPGSATHVTYTWAQETTPVSRVKIGKQHLCSGVLLSPGFNPVSSHLTPPSQKNEDVVVKHIVFLFAGSTSFL